ncbi:hypothetical protein [Streptomyces hilarionis]|uniref:hypothetical protein n=1 Tax=Streptomyces hilarionis TaxID=2839954 RepID=UPI00211A16D4|nr:hypothetical protein [Streptomyces hilarionis]MCQ9135835.1 hypothetical protein [Streptomyces hilarionis]
MTLARALPTDASGWWFFLGTFALYAAARWFFSWRRARRDGDEHPVRAAFAEEDDPRPATAGGFRSYRQFFGFVGSAVLVVVVAGLTAGRLRLALLGTLVPLLITALAYLDFRQARKERAQTL